MNRAELLAACFGSHAEWNPKNGTPDLHVEFTMADLMRESEPTPPPLHVLAHVGLTWRTVDTEIGEQGLAGVCLVCTDPAWRGHGLMRACMEAALTLAVARGYRLAGLFTDRPSIYRSLGFMEATVPGVEHFMVSPLGQPRARLYVPTISSTRGTW